MDDHKELATNHERIWLSPLCEVDERCWCEDPQHCDECGLAAVEYVRADIAKAEIERLRAEGLRFAEWVEQVYGSMPRDTAPGPPVALVAEMRRAYQQQERTETK